MTSYQLESLVQTVQQLSLARDLESIMAIVRTTARNLTGADGATFILKENDLCYYADEDAISPLWKGQRFPMKSCVSGWAMINRKPAIIEDIYSDERIPIEAYKPTFVRSMVMVPIRTVNPIGAIGNYWAKKHAPTAEEIQLLQSLADITSVSIENLNAFDELETFIYKLSHDIRGPVARILGLVNITDIEDPVWAKQFYTNINQQADRLDDILKSLVETMSSRKHKKEYHYVEFNQIVEESLKSLEAIEGFNEIIIEKNIPAECKSLSNKPLLLSLFQNIIENSIKYRKTNIKDPRVKISISNHADGIKIIIADNGVGIPKELHKDVFKMFFRATERSNGSGLGLYIVDYIIKQLEGEIVLESMENIGTTISIYLRHHTGQKHFSTLPQTIYTPKK